MFLKIAYILPSCTISGGAAVVCQHANRLKKRGHHLTLISILPVTSFDWFPNQMVDVISFDQAVSNDYDVVVATAWNTSFYLNRLKSTSKVYFVQSDETRFFSNNSINHFLAGLSYFHNGIGYITEAKWIKQWLSSGFGRVAELIPNGLDETIFYPDVPLEKKGNRLRILLEGPIDVPYKGMKNAFAAVEDVDAEIWCVSSFGVPKSNWRCDRFFPGVPMSKMRSIYSSCDILLKMSEVEGFFGPPLEMMACGGVAVVSKVTGYDEYIIDEVNALVVDKGDILGANNALKRIISDANLRNKLIQEGRRTAKNWNWELSIDTLEAYFKNEISTNINSHSQILVNNDTLSLIYTQMSKLIDIDLSAKPLPPHVEKLALLIVNSKIFFIFADFVKKILSLHRYFLFKK